MLSSDLGDIKDVVKNGICIGCGVCSAVSDEITVNLNTYGEYQAKFEKLSSEELLKTSKVCPFSDHASNESVIASSLFSSQKNISLDPAIGFYKKLYAGFSVENRLAGSSGGIATWILEELLRQGHVDKVIRVGQKTSGKALFNFEVIDNIQDIKKGATSFYYPVSYASIIEYIRDTPGRYAITGVPCFHKALHLLKQHDSLFRERILYHIGIVCGQMKSTRYLEFLLRTTGVQSGTVSSACFRKKDLKQPANNYLFEATVKESEGHERTVSIHNKEIGTNWAMGLFKPKACDYCDDVFAETADVAVMDGWLPRYVVDGKGTSFLVVRSSKLLDLIESGRRHQSLELEEISKKDVIQSQRGGLNHRRRGLRYRLHMDKGRRWAPKKRVSPQKDRNFIFRIDQHIRILLRIISRQALHWQISAGKGLWLYNLLLLSPRFAFKLVNKFKNRIKDRGFGANDDLLDSSESDNKSQR